MNSLRSKTLSLRAILLLNLKNQRRTYFISFLFLLIYLFSNSPSILFHHHEPAVHSYQEATECEKAIHFADHLEGCDHKMHFSESHEDCSLCDVHSVSLHTASTFYLIYSIDEHSDKIIVESSSLFSETVSNFSNRGPPSISSITV